MWRPGANARAKRLCLGVLGAALQATERSFGLVTVPCGWRYHPAITAQAAATLAQMFPRRLAWLALGTGRR
ncbi:LLM class flavin-dependent oxidoreductase (plasmid) [Sinorhizobium meliloti]|nr:LLM class flavin-dependent oxidoreductase [Sinorhizobium meliloti]